MIVTVILCGALSGCVGIAVELRGVHGSCAANRAAIEQVVAAVPVPPGWVRAGIRCVVEVPA